MGKPLRFAEDVHKPGPPRRQGSPWTLRLSLFMSIFSHPLSSLSSTGDVAPSPSFPSSPPATRPASPPSQQQQQAAAAAEWERIVDVHRVQQCCPPRRSGVHGGCPGGRPRSVMIAGASFGPAAVSFSETASDASPEVESVHLGSPIW